MIIFVLLSSLFLPTFANDQKQIKELEKVIELQIQKIKELETKISEQSPVSNKNFEREQNYELREMSLNDSKIIKQFLKKKPWYYDKLEVFAPLEINLNQKYVLFNSCKLKKTFPTWEHKEPELSQPKVVFMYTGSQIIKLKYSGQVGYKHSFCTQEGEFIAYKFTFNESIKSDSLFFASIGNLKYIPISDFKEIKLNNNELKEVNLVIRGNSEKPSNQITYEYKKNNFKDCRIYSSNNYKSIICGEGHYSLLDGDIVVTQYYYNPESLTSINHFMGEVFIDNKKFHYFARFGNDGSAGISNLLERIVYGGIHSNSSCSTPDRC